MTKKINKIISTFSITIPLILSACGGSGSSSAALNASDIDVSVSCEEWRSRGAFSLPGEADCDISIKNNSAASGTIYVLWSWKDGNTSCGVGSTKNSNGDPIDINIDANESGTISTVQRMACAPGYANPVAEDIRVTVRN